MKYLLAILCLFIFSCDSGGDGICSYENACNYGENAECYYFLPADIAGDTDEYHCGDMQVLQDIIDINTSNDFPVSNVGEYFITGISEEGHIIQYPFCTLSETGRVAGIVLNDLYITALPESIGDLSNLEVLYLSLNQLTSIPESIGDLENLVALELTYNQLISLPENIGDLSNLEYLGLYNNQLTSIPESIGELSSLEWLGLYGNQLTSLPESICNLPETCHIDLTSNNLCEEYHYDCVDDWNQDGSLPQDQTNCCEGVNDEGETVPNWTTCP